MFRNTEKNKKIIWLINVIFLQAMLALFNALWNYLAIHGLISVSLNIITVFSLAVGILLTIIALGLINEIVRLSRKEHELEINKAVMAKDKELIEVLSIQRHDFQNHLQVIMGLVQLGRNDSAVNYIKEVTRNLRQEVSATHKIKNVEIAAMFSVKKLEAEEKQIQLQLEMHSDLGGLVISATDISSILGNLLENAIDAVETVEEEEERVVNVSFAEDQQHFIISVLNKKPLIPQDIQSKIFQKGFSTKGVSGSGLGLAIVKELTEKHGGSIHLVSDAETGTLFTLKFPKSFNNLPA